MIAGHGRRLLFDEIYAPRLALTLRDEGCDVAAVLEHPELCAASDVDLFDWAASQSRRIVPRNINDFCMLLRRATENGMMTSGLLLVDRRVLRRNQSRNCWQHCGAGLIAVTK